MKPKLHDCKPLGVAGIPLEIHRRLQLESARTGVAINTIVAAALDAHLPKSMRVVIGKSDSANRRRA